MGVVALRPVLRAKDLLEAVARPGGRRQGHVQGRDHRARLAVLARMTSVPVLSCGVTEHTFALNHLGSFLLTNLLMGGSPPPHPPGRHRGDRHREHSGLVRTSFGAEDQAARLAIMIRAARRFMKTLAQGAVTPIYVACSPHGRVTGRYFAHRQPKTASKARLRHPWRGAAVAGQRRPGRPDTNRVAPRRNHLSPAPVGRPGAA